MMKKITVLALMLLGVIATGFSQGTLTGTVMDSGVPLPGANVVLKGFATGTTTDFDGKFSLTVPEGSGTVEISYVGFATNTITYQISNGATKDLGAIIRNFQNY